MVSVVKPPFYPIVYVRGYAGTDSDVEDTVSDPYMGFNLGSTRIRTVWTGATELLYFESPLVRLMKDFDYKDVYSAGLSMADLDEVQPGDLDSRSIIIYRYYDLVSSVFGAGKQVEMEDFGKGLSDLTIKIRDRVCVTEEDRQAFKVYLVGHSMGGLVVRCFLQNDGVGTAEAKAFVDKVFTYATPHNGIELDIIGNVPAFFNYHSVTNFNRDRMRQYLALPAPTDPKSAAVNDLNGRFDLDRFFCLVGTNSKDYAVAAGWSARVVGPFSDGLVRINDATLLGPSNDGRTPTRLAPSAHVYRSHSGYYGIVNYEEGYQNLTRFLFGDVRVDGELDIREITLPREVQLALKKDSDVRASYHFESVARVRGVHWDLSRRVANENSTVFRTYGELFPNKSQGDVDRKFHDRPRLFTVFLSTKLRVNKRSARLGFSIDLGVLVPDYELDGKLWLVNHYPGGYIFREKMNLDAIPPRTDDGSWDLRYGFDSNTPNRATKSAEQIVTDGGIQFRIPVVQKNRPGIDATLVLTARSWNN